MRQFLAAGLMAAMAAQGSAVCADPSTPQLSPLHRQREDAQRLTEQQRGLGRETVVEPASTLPSTAPPSTSTTGDRVARGAGVILLSLAGLSAAVSVPLFAADPGPSGDNTAATGLLITAGVSATLGIVFLVSSRSVQVTPTVSPKAAGVAIMGRL